MKVDEGKIHEKKRSFCLAKLSSHQLFHNTSVLSFLLLLNHLLLLSSFNLTKTFPVQIARVFFGWTKTISTVKPGGFTQKNRIVKTFLPYSLEV